ncbi:ABC transporter substrate-binding protein [Streptomyces sp. NPDC057253]|uniref:ABC transporter substrate-binding protein n=1 Tax=Streptomyces sp. NPDC057253 TaxID=3346069 RepID=UPI003627C6A9
MRRTPLRAAVLVAALALSAACGDATPPDQSTAPDAAAFKPVKQKPGSTLTVWADSTRQPAVEAYRKAHPDVKIDLVTYSGQDSDLRTKIQLFDRSGSGWPDVVFSTSLTTASWTSTGAHPYAAPLNKGLLPEATLSGFSKGALDPCTSKGTVHCLRNDVAPTLLWYDKKLMTKWGYQVPTTWEEYRELGEKVAEEHPGYLVGSVDVAPNTYLWPSRCPAEGLTGPKEIHVDLTDPKCTRMTRMLDTLLKSGSLTTESPWDASFAKTKADKVLMMPGPTWYGQYLFAGPLKVPAGRMAAAAPLKWSDDDRTYTGDYGGGVWLVSSHSRNLKGASGLVKWLTTDNSVQVVNPGFPAFTKAAEAWLVNPKNTSYFAGDVAPVFQQASAQIWPGWTDTTEFNVTELYKSTVLSKVTQGATITSLLPDLQQAIEDKASSLGYKVK